MVRFHSNWSDWDDDREKLVRQRPPGEDRYETVDGIDWISKIDRRCFACGTTIPAGRQHWVWLNWNATRFSRNHACDSEGPSCQC